MGRARSESASFEPIPRPPVLVAPPAPPSCPKDVVKGEEWPENYGKGGYKRVLVGDKLKQGRYEIIRKLGYGEYSTVWLALDHESGEHVAIKCFKAEMGYWEAARQEWRASCEIAETGEDNDDPALQHLLHVRDFFPVASSTFEGQEHACLVSELYGEHLYSLNKRLRRVGLALDTVKAVARQLLIAVDFLHDKVQLVHTDIKPENVLVKLVDADAIVRANFAATPTARPPVPDGNVIASQPLKSPLPTGMSAYAAVEIEKERSKEGDSTSLSPSNSPLSTISVSSPASSAPSFEMDRKCSLEEVVRGQRDTITQQMAGLSIDRQAFEVVLADLGSTVPDTRQKKNSRAGTREYRAPELFLGSIVWTGKVDVWALACTLFECATGEALFPKPQYRNKRRPPWPLEAESLMMMLELLGDAKFPVNMLDYGNQAASLLHGDGDLLDATLRRSRKNMSLRDVLIEHFSFAETDADSFASFLCRMLKLDPAERASAADMLADPFLSIA